MSNAIVETVETNDKMQIELRAMRQYRTYYEERNPLPQRQVYATDNRMVYVALTVLVIASVIVSAFHTIPIFVGEQFNLITLIVGVAAFMMVELGIVSLTYIKISKEYEEDADKHVDVLRWLKIGLYLIFAVAVGANIYSTTRAAGFTHPLADLAIALLVGGSAPLMAFVCGEVLAMVGVDGQVQQRRLDDQFNVSMVVYQDEFLKAWDARKARILGTVKVEKENSQAHSLNSVNEQQPLPSGSVNSVNGSVNGYSKNMNSRQVIEQFFASHPERIKDKLDVLLTDIEQESGTKVGRTSVHNVRSEWLKKD